MLFPEHRNPFEERFPGKLQELPRSPGISGEVPKNMQLRKRTRHINIRYFYVTNKVRFGDVVIVYHPTGKLVGDYLTKPLNGTPFKNHRNTIMGITDGDIIYYKVKYEQEKAAYLKRIGYERDGTSSSNIKMIEDAVGVC